MQRNDDEIRQLQKRDILELLFLFPALLLPFAGYALRPRFPAHMQEHVELLFFSFSFSLVHLLAGNILSFLYDLNRFLLPRSLRPVAPAVTPGRVRFLGGLVLLVSLVDLYFIM